MGKVDDFCASCARVALLSTIIGISAVALMAAPALAAGTGYGPTAPQAPTAPGGFNTVVTSQTLPVTGGSVTATSSGAKLLLSVPPGDFPKPVQVTVLAPPTPPPGSQLAFGISFALGGQAVSGTLPKPVTFTITDSSIKAGDVVVEWNGSSWVRYAGATASNGSVTITLTSDPAFAVEAAAVQPVPGATTATTGVPMDGLGAIAGGLVLVGGAGLVVIRRRRRASARA